MVRTARVAVLVLSLLAALVVVAPASANVPGANGQVTFAYDQYTPTGPESYDNLVWLDPTSGTDARTSFSAGTTGPLDHTVASRIFGSPDSRHFAMSSYRKSATSGPFWRGGIVGNNDALGVSFASSPIFPDLVMGADFCQGDAQVVAALADGNFLWHRFQIRRPNCNSSSGEVRQHDHVITGPGGLVVRGGLFAVSGSSYSDPIGTVFGSGADPNVVYATRTSGDVGFYKLDLTTQAATRLSTTVPFTPNDVTPDGRYILGDVSNSIRSFDTQTGNVATLITGAAAAALAPASSPATFIQKPVASPDGTSIAFFRQNATDARVTFDAIVVMGVDGSNPRVLRQLGPQQFVSGTTLNWQPAPGIEVGIEGDQLVGDIVELDLTLRNPTPSPFSPLRFDTSGHAEGLVFNTALYSPEHRAGFQMISGPAPALVTSIGAMSQSQHQYTLGVDTPGNVQIRSKVYATGPTGGEVQVEKVMYLVSRNRDLPKAEEAMMVAGGWTELQAASQDDFDRLMTQNLLAINAKLPPKLRTTTAFERGLARMSDLPDNALSWLPADTKEASDAWVAFNVSHANARDKVWKGKLGSLYDKAIKVPVDYWSEQVTGDPNTTIPVGTALYDEGAYWANKGGTAAKGYANDAYALATDPKRQHQFSQAVQKSILDMDDRMRHLAKVAPDKARAVADLIKRDPVKGAQMLGTLTGTIEGEVTYAVAETALTPNKAGIARGVKSIGGRMASFVDDVGDTARSLKGMRAASKVDDSLLDAARHGMPKADQALWQGIVRQVETHVARKGYDVKVELSFRPRNLHSAAIGDAGAGKNMFMKGKAGNDIDLLLGMDPSGLGKLVIYKPVKPANFAKLPPSMRKELEQRIVDIEKARAEWLNPKSNLGRARTGKGVTLTSELTNQKTGAKIGTTTIKMRVAGYEKNGTISVKYLEQVVDGKTIVKPGKPKWVVSDYDGNAILQVGGKDLPGGAVRSLVESEVMRLQRENGVAMATSFHGFTYNGLDLPGKYYRNNFHFLLEGMSREQANKALLKYLRKYSESDKDFEELVKSYSHGDYVVHVTADAAFATQGL